MKIALVSPYDFPYPGGVTEHIRHLDKAFRELGHETRIIAASSAPRETLPANFIPVSHEVVPMPFNGSTARLALSPEIIQRVGDILKKEQFDVVHIHEPATPLLNWAVLDASQALNVGTFHAFIEDPRVNDTLKPVRALIGQKLHGRILVSPSLEPAYASPLFGNYRVIPNGIDFARFSGAGIRPIDGLQDGRPTILFVGRSEPRKGLPVLLRALLTIKKAVPGARLVVVGAIQSEEQTRLQGEIQAHGLENDVVLAGRVSDEDLPRYYRSANLFCAPSLGGESFGIVLLEAMASGLPIVASQIAGYQSVLHPGREGLLVPPGDPQALADAAATILTDSAMRNEMSACGPETAAQYDWSRVAPQVLGYYHELMAHRPATRPAFTFPKTTWHLRNPASHPAKEFAHVRIDLNGWIKMEMVAKY